MGSIAKQAGSIPSEGWAGVVVDEGPNFKFEVAKVPVPEPGPGDVLIKLNVTGLCLSDVKFMEGDIGFAKMSQFGVRSPGHEGAGVIVKVGSNVRSLKVGQRVGYKPIWDVCHSCELCRTGKDNYCPSLVQTGIRVPGKDSSSVSKSLGPRLTCLKDPINNTSSAPSEAQSLSLMGSATTLLVPSCAPQRQHGVRSRPQGSAWVSGLSLWVVAVVSGCRVFNLPTTWVPGSL